MMDDADDRKVTESTDNTEDKRTTKIGVREDTEMRRTRTFIIPFRDLSWE